MIVASGLAGSGALKLSCSGTRRWSNSLWAEHAQAVIYLQLGGTRLASTPVTSQAHD